MATSTLIFVSFRVPNTTPSPAPPTPPLHEQVSQGKYWGLVAISSWNTTASVESSSVVNLSLVPRIKFSKTEHRTGISAISRWLRMGFRAHFSHQFFLPSSALPWLSPQPKPTGVCLRTRWCLCLWRHIAKFRRDTAGKRQICSICEKSTFPRCGMGHWQRVSRCPWMTWLALA